MHFTDLTAKTAKPRDKDYKIGAQRGLYLLIKKNGAKYWRMKYRFGTKEKVLAFGVYPEVTLLEARELRDRARAQIRQGLDPSVEKKKAKLTKNGTLTFAELADQWINMKEKRWSPQNTAKVVRSFERNVYPYVGNIPVNEITSPLLSDRWRNAVLLS